MSEHGVVVEFGMVRFERLLPGPIERVWEYLVDPELRGTWFASGPLERRKGGALTFTFAHSRLAPAGEKAPAKHAGAEGFQFSAQVTQFDPPRLLAWSWDESEVVFELAPKGNEVLLTLTHRRLPSQDEMRNVSSATRASATGHGLNARTLRSSRLAASFQSSNASALSSLCA